MEEKAFLIIASSEIDSNLYYATKFLAPDLFIFLQIGEEKIVLLNDLELERGKEEARVDTVLAYSSYENMAKSKGIEKPDMVDVLHEFLQERGIKKLVVPAYFGIRQALLLQEKGYHLEVKKRPFLQAREIKSPQEIGYIRDTLKRTEEAMDMAIQLIKDTTVHNGYLYRGGRPLTSEEVKREIAIYLLKNDLIATHTIVSCGQDTAYPHKEGEGPLRAHVPIIIDIFPRSLRHRYFADMTRTVVKGRASPRLKKMYEAVCKAQDIALSMIRAGADGSTVHYELMDFFKSEGFETGNKEGKMQGFIHGTGHGVGLDIHEPPRINRQGDRLKAGQVVTVEPGLYYMDTGGVRLEDMIVVTENTPVNLTTYPKILEI